VIVATVSFIAGSLVTLAVVSERLFAQAQERLRQEVGGGVARDVVALANLRAGHTEKAIELLERSVDQAVITLPSAVEVAHLPVSIQRNLGLAKLYRARFPPPEDRAERLAAIFAAVPTPEGRYCSPVLRAVLQDEGATQR
jgi:hypothetical protein